MLEQAELVSNMGSVEINIRTGERVWSDGFYRLLDYVPGEVRPDLNLFLAKVVPEQRTSYINWYEGIIRNKEKEGSIEVHLMRNNGILRIVHASILGYFDAEGNMEKVVSVIRDITESKKSEMELEKSRLAAIRNSAVMQSIINSPKDMFIVAMDRNFRLIAFTKGYEDHVMKMVGQQVQIGTNMLDIIPAHLKEKKQLVCERALKGEQFVQEVSYEFLEDEGAFLRTALVRSSMIKA